jgi:hypothetical protein
MTVMLLWKCNKLIVTQHELLRYYGNAIYSVLHGNATNSLLHNMNYYVTMEMQYTQCYTTGTVTLLWKCNMVQRSCYQDKPNMSQYVKPC